MVVIKDIPQNSPEWDALKLGKPSASQFKKIVTSTGAPSKSRNKYLYKLAGEIVSGTKEDGFKSFDMELGHEREDESRKLYEFINGVIVEQVGFCFFDEKREFGCSPDGLVGLDGGFETKNACSEVHLDRLEHGWSKVDHYQQVQGSLYVTGRKWWDLQSYSRGFKPITVRFERDEDFIRKLTVELRIFIKDLKLVVEKYSI